MTRFKLNSIYYNIHSTCTQETQRTVFDVCSQLYKLHYKTTELATKQNSFGESEVHNNNDMQFTVLALQRYNSHLYPL